jgi:hypothetical protein
MLELLSCCHRNRESTCCKQIITASRTALHSAALQLSKARATAELLPRSAQALEPLVAYLSSNAPAPVITL